MKLSRKFVSDYIDLPDKDIKQIAEDMTRIGNEYDSCGKLIPATNLVIGEVITCEKHPDSDHLNVCTVDIGGELLNIVCGSFNAKVGLKVVVATENCFMPSGKQIIPGEVMGVFSEGMLCSGRELNIDGYENKKGLYILDDSYNVGDDFYTLY